MYRYRMNLSRFHSRYKVNNYHQCCLHAIITLPIPSSPIPTDCDIIYLEEWMTPQAFVVAWQRSELSAASWWVTVRTGARTLHWGRFP